MNGRTTTSSAAKGDARQPLLCPPALLVEHCSAVLVGRGLSKTDAEIVARSLVHTNLRGVDSHGVTRMQIYVDRLERGLVNPKPQISITHDKGGTLLFDGDNGMGAVVTSQALDVALDRIEAHGSVTVGIRNSNHYGAGAFYAERAAQHDAVAFLYSNAPSTMALWGGVEPYLGTNPYTFAAPAGSCPPIILDMATSVVARGKIILAAESGDSIPPGWAIDKDGVETTDAQEALDGSVLPFGGPKGYGIALMVDMMAGIMTGAAFGPRIGDLYRNMDQPQNVGVFMQLVHAGAFQPVEAFKRSMDDMIKEIKTSRTAPGVDEVLVPGEIEAASAAERSSAGVPLPLDLVHQLDELAPPETPSLAVALGLKTISAD